MSGISKKITESDIQKWFENQIKDSTLSDQIHDLDSIFKQIECWNSTDIEQPFSVDYLLRKKYLNNAQYILEKLENIELVLADKSVSIKKGEVLKPDLICFNWESNLIILFELKENAAAARQALTEILAYEQEIQNHLPFSSTCDIVYVVASPEWSALLEHSIASLNMWSNKKVLALKIDTSCDKWKLNPHIPNAWTNIRANGLPPSSLSTLNLVIHPKNGDDVEEDLPHAMMLAKDLIVRSAEKMNVSGFLIINENTNPLVDGKWIITVAVIHPIGFTLHADQYGDIDRENDLIGFLRQESDKHLSNPPAALFDICKSAKALLDTEFSVQFENICNWEMARVNIANYCMPIFGDFFGELFDFAMQRFSQNKKFEDWSDCRFLIPLIDEITHYRCLNDSVFRIDDIFRIGTLISKYNNFKIIADSNKNMPGFLIWTGRLKWIEIELIDIINRIIFCEFDKEEIAKLDLHRLKNDGLEYFEEWLFNEIVLKNGDLAHRLVYELGLYIGAFSDDFFRSSINFEDLDEIWQDNGYVIKIINDLTKIAIENDFVISEDKSQLFQQLKSTLQSSELCDPIISLKKHTTANSIIDAPHSIGTINSSLFRLINDILIPLLNFTISPMNLPLEKCFSENIDWHYLMDDAKKLFEKGDKHPILLFGNDSQLGIISSDHFEECKFLEPIEDITTDVYYLDQYSSINIIIRKTWDELRKICSNNEK